MAQLQEHKLSPPKFSSTERICSPYTLEHFYFSKNSQHTYDWRHTYYTHIPLRGYTFQRLLKQSPSLVHDCCVSLLREQPYSSCSLLLTNTIDFHPPNFHYIYIHTYICRLIEKKGVKNWKFRRRAASCNDTHCSLENIIRWNKSIRWQPTGYTRKYTYGSRNLTAGLEFRDGRTMSPAS